MHQSCLFLLRYLQGADDKIGSKTMIKQVDPDAEPYKGLLGYFGAGVVAAYQNERDKYRIDGDSFHGRLTLTNDYYERLTPEDRVQEFINVEFGYRTLKNGDTAIVIVLPDLTKKSKGHVRRWSGFRLSNPEWSEKPDQRFQQWARPNLAGVWNKGPGVRSRLSKLIHTINCLTSEALDKSLFTHELDASLSFPAAENSHQYQDAHRELYRYLIDGLDADCMRLLVARLGKTINVSGKTVEVMKKIFPNLDSPSNFCAAYALVSNQRGPAAHKVRQSAVTMPATAQFKNDLELCVAGLKELLTTLEKELAMNGEKATERNDAKKHLPQIVRPSDPSYSICDAARMKGKTVERVEFGSRKKVENVQSEVLIIHFTDGSIMSIQTRSNFGNLADDIPDLEGHGLDVNFSMHWVPEK